MTDWENGSRYNAVGEFNPRLIACDDCGVYNEPERMKFHLEQYLCLTCATQNGLA